MTGTWFTGWVTGDIVTAAEFRKGAGSIFDTTLGATTALIDVTSIPANYAHLLLTLYARSDAAGATAQVGMRLNADAGANYDVQQIGASAATANALESFGGLSGLWVAQIPAVGAAANLFGSAQAFLPHYAGSINQKSCVALSFAKSGLATGNMRVDLFGSGWRSTAAVNRITLFSQNGNFVAGTRCTIHALGA